MPCTQQTSDALRLTLTCAEQGVATLPTCCKINVSLLLFFISVEGLTHVVSCHPTEEILLNRRFERLQFLTKTHQGMRPKEVLAKLHDNVRNETAMLGLHLTKTLSLCFVSQTCRCREPSASVMR